MSQSPAGHRSGRLQYAWRRLRPLLGDSVARVVVLGAVSIGAGLAEAGVLALVAQVAAGMVVGDDMLRTGFGPFTSHIVLPVALTVAFALALARLGFQLVVAWLPARISADVQARLRRNLFTNFSGASWTVKSDERQGHLQELMTSQVAQATQAALNVASLLSAAAMFAALSASAFVLSAPIALVVLLAAAVMFALLRPLSSFGRDAARDLSQAEMDHAAGVSESVALAEETHVFGAAFSQRKQVNGLIDAASSALFRFRLTALLAASTYQSLAILLIVAGLGGLYATNSGNLASLGAVVLILVRAGAYGQQLQGAYHGLNQMLPYLERLEGAVNRYMASAEPEDGRPLSTINILIFEDVGFSYRPGRLVLQDLTFEIQVGESIGVVGPSGAGKSTLVDLLLGLRTPQTGAFLVNGEPASSFARADWRRLVAYVPQEARVFQGTVADNIRFFRQISDAAVEEAARQAHIHHDIVGMPLGYETVIGQRSDAISGGQRQRICLARALAGDPGLLVLDEPTSALDLASEAAVKESLSELLGKMTLVIVAHRLSTLSICDRVLVLVDGSIEAFAPARELVESNPFFRRAAALSGRPATTP